MTSAETSTRRAWRNQAQPAPEIRGGLFVARLPPALALDLPEIVMAYSDGDIAQLEARLAAYLEAEIAVLRNQSYTIGDRSLTRANLSEIRKGIADVRGELAIAQGRPLTKGRARRGVIVG